MMLNKLLAANTFAICVMGCIAFSCSDEEPGIAYTPALTAPAFGASNQSLEVTLQWQDGDVASADKPEPYVFDVYLGTSENDLQLVASNLIPEEFKCGSLALNATYFWKVIAKSNGRSKESAVGKFVTTQELPRVTIGSKTLMVFPGDYVYPDPYSLTGFEGYTKVSGATSWEDGEQNTKAILNYYGENYSRGWGVAADYCDKLNAYGYNDWYLPSILEIDAVVTEYKLLKYDTDEYWSSTESEVNNPGDVVLTKSKFTYTGFAYSVEMKTAFHGVKCRCVRQD